MWKSLASRFGADGEYAPGTSGWREVHEALAAAVAGMLRDSAAEVDAAMGVLRRHDPTEVVLQAMEAVQQTADGLAVDGLFSKVQRPLHPNARGLFQACLDEDGRKVVELLGTNDKGTVVGSLIALLAAVTEGRKRIHARLDTWMDDTAAGAALWPELPPLGGSDLDALERSPAATPSEAASAAAAISSRGVVGRLSKQGALRLVAPAQEARPGRPLGFHPGLVGPHVIAGRPDLADLRVYVDAPYAQVLVVDSRIVPGEERCYDGWSGQNMRYDIPEGADPGFRPVHLETLGMATRKQLCLAMYGTEDLSYSRDRAGRPLDEVADGHLGMSVGELTWYDSDSRWDLTDMAVHPAWRRRGIGTLMWRLVSEMAERELATLLPSDNSTESGRKWGLAVIPELVKVEDLYESEPEDMRHPWYSL